MIKFFKLLLKPLIWIKDFQDNAVSYLTKKVEQAEFERDMMMYHAEQMLQ